VVPPRPVGPVLVPEVLGELRATLILADPSAASLAKAPNGVSIGPRPTVARRAPSVPTTAAPEIRRGTANEHRAATTERSAAVGNVALDQVAPVETIDRRVVRGRVTAERRVRTLRAPPAMAATERTLRPEHPDRAVVPPDRAIARARHVRTTVTTPTLAIADPVCRRATVRRVAHARSVDPAS